MKCIERVRYPTGTWPEKSLSMAYYGQHVENTKGQHSKLLEENVNYGCPTRMTRKTNASKAVGNRQPYALIVRM